MFVELLGFGKVQNEIKKTTKVWSFGGPWTPIYWREFAHQ